MNILVAGGGGFIGSHIVNRMVSDGHDVVAADIKPLDEWSQLHGQAYNISVDLRGLENCYSLLQSRHFDEVYMLAADMGGMGYIETHKLNCMLSVLQSTNMLVAANAANVGRFFYSSSACVYAASKQSDPTNPSLKESDAYPAEAEDGYGWEKLFTERMCRHFTEDTGLITRVARYHNVYGTHTHYDGGREKAPAAICRKVIEAKLSGVHEIDIWGDGRQTRSFMFNDDCVEGTIRIMRSENYTEPLNLGSDRLISINELVDLIEDIAGIGLKRTYNLSAPQGVRGRNSDNALLEKTIGWVPHVALEDGLEKTYEWIYNKMVKSV